MIEEITDDDQLYRRLVSFHVNSDGTINSAAFKLRGKPDPSISVDLARLTTPQESLERAGKPELGLGVLVASVPRSLDFCVRHDPLRDNPAHSLIEGENNKAKCRLLAEATRLLIEPS